MIYEKPSNNLHFFRFFAICPYFFNSTLLLFYLLPFIIFSIISYLLQLSLLLLFITIYYHLLLFVATYYYLSLLSLPLLIIINY